MAEKKFGKMEVRVDRPLASEALKLQARLFRAAGGLAEKLPSILASRKDGVSDEVKSKADAEALSAIAGIFDRVSPDEYAALVGDVIGLGTIKRPSGSYDQLDLDGDFHEEFALILPVTLYILQQVFGDFFSAALASGKRAATGKA